MESLRKHENRRAFKNFGIVFSVFFFLIAAWSFYKLNYTRSYVLVGISASLLLISFFLPQLLKYPYRGWMTVGHYLMIVNSTILLVLIFLLVMTPLGLMMRLFGKRPLDLSYSKDDSYWSVRRIESVNFEKQF